MKQVVFILVAGVFFCVQNMACKKKEIPEMVASTIGTSMERLIDAAHSYFDKYVAGIGSSLPVAGAQGIPDRGILLKRQPAWKEAYVGSYGEKGKAVIVPLRYDKPLNFKTSFGDGQSLSIQDQSKLWILQDSLGRFTVEVVTKIPGKKKLPKHESVFSGYVLHEDWWGNTISTFRYTNGKGMKVVKPRLPVINENSRYQERCDMITWYECDEIDERGDGYGCVYLYRELINCTGNDDNANPQGGGGNAGEEGEADCSFVTRRLAGENVSELASITTVSETTAQRIRSYEWIIYKGVYDPWHAISHETGIHKKVSDPYHPWEWESLTHNPVITFAGNVLGGNISVTTNTAEAHIEPYRAIMELNYHVAASATCKGIPISIPADYITSKAFGIND